MVYEIREILHAIDLIVYEIDSLLPEIELIACEIDSVLHEIELISKEIDLILCQPHKAWFTTPTNVDGVVNHALHDFLQGMPEDQFTVGHRLGMQLRQCPLPRAAAR